MPVKSTPYVLIGIAMGACVPDRAETEKYPVEFIVEVFNGIAGGV